MMSSEANDKPDMKRIVVQCPFCEHKEEETVPDQNFEGGHRRVKSRVGEHILTLHKDRIYEIAAVMTQPYNNLIAAMIDTTRRTGRALTDLQKVANDLRLP